MTKDDIIRMAQESDLLTTTEPNGYQIWIPENLEAFANLIALAEREACAKLCDEQEKRSKESSEKSKRERDQFMYHHCAITAKWNAEIIRARGQA